MGGLYVMKIETRIVAVLLIFLNGCSTTYDWLAPSLESKDIESAILWTAKLDSTWVPIGMNTVLKDSTKFEKQGKFYEVRDDLAVFGHRATYVGVVGVDQFSGPNAVLVGSPKTVAAYVTEKYGLDFKTKAGRYMCELKKDVRLLIGEHPHIPGSSIIIGAYTGP